jgi:hypothetical protein
VVTLSIVENDIVLEMDGGDTGITTCKYLMLLSYTL